MTQHFDTSFIIIYLVFIIFSTHSAHCCTVTFQIVDVLTKIHLPTFGGLVMNGAQNIT